MTFIEAVDTLMPTFDPEIRRIADRLLIKGRGIDSRVGVFASEITPGEPGVRPVTIKMIDAKTKEHVETLEVDACLVATGRVPMVTGLGLDAAGIELDRGFVVVDDHMRVLTKKGGEVIPSLWCIGDANGKLMLAHAASAQVRTVKKFNEIYERYILHLIMLVITLTQLIYSLLYRAYRPWRTLSADLM